MINEEENLEKQEQSPFSNREHKIEGRLINKETPVSSTIEKRQIERQNADESNSKFSSFDERSLILSRFSIFHKDINIKSFAAVFIYIIDFFKAVFISLILITMSPNSNLQLILISIINFIYIFYWIVYKPFLRRDFQMLTLLSELNLTFVSICFLAMGVSEKDGDESIEERFKIGWVAFVGNFLSKIVHSTFIIHILIRKIRKTLLGKS